MMENFETIYCRHYRVSPARFSKSLMLRCCHCWSRPLTLFVLLLYPKALARDLHHLDAFRAIQSPEDYATELAFIKTYNQYDIPRWRKALQIWPSTRKLSRYVKLLT